MTRNTASTVTCKKKAPRPEMEYDTFLKRLLGRAFGMHDKVVEPFKKLYGHWAHIPDGEENKPLVRTTFSWLIAPFSSWPVDFLGLSKIVQSRVKRDLPLDDEIKFLLRLVKDLPSDRAQEVIGEYEHKVQHGAYDHLLQDDSKYRIRLKELLEDPEFHADLAMIRKLYDLTKFQSKNSKKILRRTLVCERNIRLNFLFRWRTEKQRFERVFDCFCWKWSLYGLEDMTPLLMKVTMNPTANGTMIFVPDWMSLDFWRDLAHSHITEIHMCRDILRQGVKFNESREQNRIFGPLVFAADEECKTLGITGRARLDHIIEKAGLSPQISDRQIRRLRAIGEAMSKQEDQSQTIAANKALMQSNSGKTAKVAEAKATYASFNQEEKAEFMKWLAE